MARLLIVAARFYEHNNDLLIAGAKAVIEAAGHEAEVLTVPGALEVPGGVLGTNVKLVRPANDRSASVKHGEDGFMHYPFNDTSKNGWKATPGIRNAYDIRLRNKHGEARSFEIQLVGGANLTLRLEGKPGLSTNVAADETSLQRVYVVAPAGSTPAEARRTDLRFWVEDVISGERVHQDSLFNGKGTQ